VFQRRKQLDRSAKHRSRGAIVAEYILTLTLVGIGAIVGLVAVRNALVAELKDLAMAITNLLP